jgi:RNA recognition motif-containing protein
MRMKNLFVGNLSFRTTETELRALFEPFGQITRIHIATDRETGRSRGFAFVDMPNDEEATRAMTALNGKDLDGRPLKVNEARPKPERGGHSYGSGSRSGGGRSGGGGGGRRGLDEYPEFPVGKREPRW